MLKIIFHLSLDYGIQLYYDYLLLVGVFSYFIFNLGFKQVYLRIAGI